MKNIFYLILIISILGCNSTGETNFKNLKKLKEGMTIEQLEDIMTNKPYKIEDAYWSDSLFVYFYNSPAAASDDYKVIFTKKDSTITKIEYGD